MKKRGFTLVELLTVIAVIAVLAALLLPVLMRVRESARQSNCLSNLRQIGMAFKQYVSDWDEAFPIPDANLLSMDECAEVYEGHEPFNGVRTYGDQLLPYSKNGQIWQCPSDLATVSYSACILIALVHSTNIRCCDAAVDGYCATCRFA
jgi:prepilin-type N-terminal cleavage/methylation domain-containing protein